MDNNKLFTNYKNKLNDFYNKHEQDKMFLLVEIVNNSSINSLFDNDLKNLYSKSVFINAVNTRLSISSELYIISCNDLEQNQAQFDYLESSDNDKMKTINNYLNNPDDYINVNYSFNAE